MARNDPPAVDARITREVRAVSYQYRDAAGNAVGNREVTSETDAATIAHIRQARHYWRRVLDDQSQALAQIGGQS